MSRIVNSETPGKNRNSILKLLVNIQPHLQKANIDQSNHNDMVAFIILSLGEIEKTIQDTILPWEKRGYWSKAEQFAADWEWVNKIRNILIKEESSKGWERLPVVLNDLYSHLVEIKPTRKNLGEFWSGSYKIYQSQKNKKKVAD